MSTNTPTPWRTHGFAALIALTGGHLARGPAPAVSEADRAGLLWAVPGLNIEAVQQEAGSGTQETRALKIGFIRSDMILQLHPRVPEIRSAVEAQLQQWQRQQQDMQTMAQSLQNELRTAQLSPVQRRNKENELQQTLEELARFQTEMWSPGGQAEQKEQELMKPVFDAIDEVIRDIAEGEEFHLIFDGSVGGLLFGHKDLDLTLTVLDRLGIEVPPPPGRER